MAGDLVTWSDTTARLVSRFDIAAEFGMDAVHNEKGARAIADLMRTMARKLDGAVQELDRVRAEGYRQGVEDAAKVAEAQPFYPDTHTGMRQQWVKDQIAAAIRSLTAPDKEGA